MAITDSDKLDFLWKKVIYGVTETDIDGKEGPNEIYSSEVLTLAQDVWQKSSDIPTSAPKTSAATPVKFYGHTTDSSDFVKQPIRMLADPTVSGGKSWLAVADVTGNVVPGSANRLRDFIPPSIGSTYLAKVYTNETDAKADSNKMNSLTTNNEWVFDYAAGVLHFPNTVPSGISSNVFLVAHQYVGTKGVGSASGGNGLVFATSNVSYDSGTQNILDVSSAVRASAVIVEVDTAWTNANNTTAITVGVTTDKDLLFKASDIDLTVAGQYRSDFHYIWPSTSDVTICAEVIQGAATAGTARVSVEIETRGTIQPVDYGLVTDSGSV
jgi:hypothetical protein